MEHRARVKPGDQEEVVVGTWNFFFIGFKKPIKSLTEAMSWNKEQGCHEDPGK